ncbi:helix-turn-helix domain-containing protein [Streptomyces sp. DW26H14]|uniref:helix-turn-helix domain-containing protein n=1 Tax=Streptomyces sp. DW26H14 TaxID=3435395 RepID=UPI00403D755B
MDTRNPSAQAHARAADGPNEPPMRANPRPGARPAASRSFGVTHDNTRHTSRFTVIGNHLAQHAELSLLAIGLAVHIQSLPAGARVDIKTLTDRFPEGATRIAAALRELEHHHYLRRERERAPGGRIVTRTISCNQPGPARQHPRTTERAATPPATRVARAQPPRTHAAPPPPPSPGPEADENATIPAAAHAQQPPRRGRHPLPAVPEPAAASPQLLLAATELLTGLRCHDPRLLLSARDTAHLAQGVAAWLERDVPPDAVRHALTSGLPPGGPRRPGALLAHRLAEQLPPPPPFRAPAAPAPLRHPLQNCDTCDRAFRAPAPGKCSGCRQMPYEHPVHLRR